MPQPLSTEQYDAANSEGNVLLTACPGSGKTRVLISKVAKELEHLNGSKKFIVALTFTNRAAEEMIERLTSMNVDLSNLWTGTIHSFCNEWILRPYSGYQPELKNGFVIADEYKSDSILDFLKEKNKLKPWVKITTRILEDGSFLDVDNAEILKNYHKLLKKEKLIDFDQLLYFSFVLLEKHLKICKTLNNLFHTICVDEYQDTQELQYSILSKIVAVRDSKTSLFFVGDKDQAIYGSLGGVAKSLKQIKAQFGNITMIEKSLSGNYRSTQRIIDYYRNFQATNIDIKSLCKYAREKGAIVFENQSIDKNNLDDVIAGLIKEALSKGIPEREICVLSPQWKLVIPMGRKLKALLPKVSFDALGLSPLIRNKENIWFKVARLFLVDPAPNMYKTRSFWASELLNEMDGLGIRVFPEMERRNKLLLRVMNSIKSNKENGLEYLMDSFEQMLGKLDINLTENPGLKLHWDYFFESTKKRLENSDFGYAQDIASYKNVFRHKSGVVVNTCHGVKGEEFHTVIAFGLLHGYIPNWSEDNGDEAARKLLYVICSRAKREVYLISENGRTTMNRKRYETTDVLNKIKYKYDQLDHSAYLADPKKKKS